MAEEAATGTPNAHGRDGAFILLAEDNPVQAAMLRALLEDQGHAVEHAANGALALLAAEKHPPDLIISDVVMPELDGYDFCRAAKADARLAEIPFMLVTSMSSPDDVIRGLDCGADSFITKPYDEKLLLARVSYLLTNRTLRAASVMRTGIELDLDGKRHFITAERQQILDLLISSYAEAVRFNDQAAARERQLRDSYETMTVLHRAAEGLNRARNEGEVTAEALARCMNLPFVGGAWLMLAADQHRAATFETAGSAKGMHDRITAAAADSNRQLSPDHASIPLTAQGRVLGTLNVLARDKVALGADQIAVLASLGNQVSAALDRARLYDALEQRVAERTQRLRGEIAEREAAEAALAQALGRLDRAMRGSSAGFWEWEITTGKIYCSPRYRAVLGFDEAETTVRGELFADEVHPDDRERVAEAVRDHLDHNAPFNTEMRLKARDGQYLWFLANGEATRDGEGKPWVMAGSILDVTSRRRSEEQLRQAQKMEAIGNLTGGIAHDFNNLLAVIIGNLDLLQLEMPAEGEAGEMAQQAMDAALKGVDLTKGLLAFARRQPLQPTRLALNGRLGTVARMMARTLGAGVEVGLDLSEDLWEVFADGSLMESALLNLLINARDAMPGGGRIIVGSANVNLDEGYAESNPDVTPGDYVAISVTDNGQGITPEVMSRLFEPFFTTKDRGKGTGLGLAMVFGFVKQSGGHVKVYSEVGHGTTMSLYLPRAPLTASEKDHAPEPGPVPTAAQSETILLVEDVASVRAAAAKQLSGAGYRVIEADTAARALQHLEAGEKIDLVFSDVVMPGSMSGADLARAVNERWPHIAVLLTSGFPQGLLEDGHRMPVGVELIGKPYRMDDLLRRLRIVFDAHRRTGATA